MAFWQWSQVANSNGNSDSAVDFLEGQNPGSLNDSCRALMAVLAKERDDISGAIVTGGSSTAYTLGSFSNFSAPGTGTANLSGQTVAFSPHTTNGAGPVTLNVDGIGAKPLRSSPGIELLAGTIIQGTPYVALYNSTDGAFYLQGFYGNPYNIPLGGGMLYTGPTAPNSSFVFPFGQAISRTTYASYFALVSTTFGVGDGSTTFNILDLRGRVPAGVDNMGGSSGGQLPGFNLGVTGGAATETLAAGNLPPHTHSGNTGGESNSHTHAYVGLTGNTTTGGGGFPCGGIATALNTGQESTGHTHAFTTDGGAGLAGSPFSLLQPTIACNYILRVA